MSSGIDQVGLGHPASPSDCYPVYVNESTVSLVSSLGYRFLLKRHHDLL